MTSWEWLFLWLILCPVNATKLGWIKIDFHFYHDPLKGLRVHCASKSSFPFIYLWKIKGTANPQYFYKTSFQMNEKQMYCNKLFIGQMKWNWIILLNGCSYSEYVFESNVHCYYSMKYWRNWWHLYDRTNKNRNLMIWEIFVWFNINLFPKAESTLFFSSVIDWNGRKL